MSELERVADAIREAVLVATTLPDSQQCRNLVSSLQRALAMAEAPSGPWSAEAIVSTLRGAVGASLMVDVDLDERLSMHVGQAIAEGLTIQRASSTRNTVVVDAATTAPFRASLGPLLRTVPARPERSSALVVDAVDGGEASHELVVRIPESGLPVEPSELRRGIVQDALDTMSMLGCDREHGPFRSVEDSEERAARRLDAIAVCRGDAVPAIKEWWATARESPNPWRLFGPALALGCLPGPAALAALLEVLETAPASVEACLVAASGLVAAERTDLDRHLVDWLDHPNPTIRAVAVEVAGFRRVLPADRVEELLLDGASGVAVAALRAARHLERTAGIDGWIRRLLAHPSAEVAWHAALTLSIGGSPDAWFEWRRGGRLTRTLGRRGAELVVLFGDAQDVGLLEQTLRGKVDATCLDQLARFGHVGCWATLVEALGDDDLRRHAARALITLFGSMTDDDREARAWRSALAKARFDPARRHRRGQPYRPSVVAAEVVEGTLSRHEIGGRLAELAIRTKTACDRDLRGWYARATSALNAGLAVASPVEGQWQPGSWDCRTAW